ncbi:PDDEXK nuclease domain-containing protein [Chitinophaga caseinilytica]|uniref:PDDEXK nuclease domain-containing protein n=1 Tax=Chitinophaga caseinilytica TaxID=2267521 RepID=UPI003C2C15C1
MITNLQLLAGKIHETNTYFLNKVYKQVNAAYTIRNWIIGYYIVEYEQDGEDRAAYGQHLFERLSQNLKVAGIKGMSATNLRLFRQFYLLYPQIHQTVSVEFENIGCQIVVDSPACKPPAICHPAGDLLDRLSFSHFIELFKANSDASRFFYEAEILRNSWSVRALQRAMSSLLFERTGLSDHREIRCERTSVDALVPEQFFWDPYLLEFLQLEDKAQYTECDLEAAIIDHLQSFLLELGKGFCFEARQKRITFDNTHYRIDLVFYHRILKCHVLVDLKLGDFSHADAGQMNVYLNYYRENESVSGDNPPIGIILCSGKNEALVRYATAGLTHKLFVSKYLINLPSEVELERILKEERGKVQKIKETAD